MGKNEELQDKLRDLLALTRECLALKEETDLLESVLFDDLWSALDESERTLSYLKSGCMI